MFVELFFSIVKSCSHLNDFLINGITRGQQQIVHMKIGMTYIGKCGYDLKFKISRRCLFFFDAGD